VAVYVAAPVAILPATLSVANDVSPGFPPPSGNISTFSPVATVREIGGGPAQPLLRQAASRMIGQDAAHHLGGDSDEVTATLPIHLLKGGDPQVEFVDQRGGLERVPGHFRAQMVSRQPSQVGANQTRQFVQRAAVAITESSRSNRRNAMLPP